MPLQSEPLSHALTRLFRALANENEATIRQHAIAVRDAFAGAAVPGPTTAGRDHLHQCHSLEVLTSAMWGIVPVFPWTTDADFRASVRTLRLAMRAGSQSGPRQTQTARPFPLEPLSDGLVSLFRALREDDALVRQVAFEARVIFLRPGAL